MAHIKAYLLIFVTVLVGHVKSEYCYQKYTNDLYCPYGCCGSSGYPYCCDTIGYTAGAIAGIVIGSLAGLAILIGSIIACCCCYRRQSTTGQVLQPQTNLGFSMVTTSTNGTQMPMSHLPPGMYAPSYLTTPQTTGYTPSMPSNTAMNTPYGVPPPDYNNVAKYP